MAVEVNGKCFESYSEALDEYISIHFDEQHYTPKHRTADRLESAERLFTSPTRRKSRREDQSPNKSTDRIIRRKKPVRKMDRTTTTSGTLVSRGRHMVSLEEPIRREVTPSATDDLCNCSVLYGVRTANHSHGPSHSTPYGPVTIITSNFPDGESVCTEDLLQADSRGGKDAANLRMKHLQTSPANLSKAQGITMRNSMLNSSSGSSICTANLTDQSMTSDSMETLKRVLFDMQQLAVEFQVINETATI